MKNRTKFAKLTKLNVPARKEQNRDDAISLSVPKAAKPVICVVDIDAFLDATPDQKNIFLKQIKSKDITEIVLRQRDNQHCGFFLRVVHNLNVYETQKMKDSAIIENRPVLQLQFYPKTNKNDIGSEIYGNPGKRWQSHKINLLQGNKIEFLKKIIKLQSNDLIYVSYATAQNLGLEQFHKPSKFRNYYDVYDMLAEKKISVAPFMIQSGSTPNEFMNQNASIEDENVEASRIVGEHYGASGTSVEEIFFYTNFDNNDSNADEQLLEYAVPIQEKPTVNLSKKVASKNDKTREKEKNLALSIDVRQHTMGKNMVDIVIADKPNVDLKSQLRAFASDKIFNENDATLNTYRDAKKTLLEEKKRKPSHTRDREFLAQKVVDHRSKTERKNQSEESDSILPPETLPPQPIRDANYFFERATDHFSMIDEIKKINRIIAFMEGNIEFFLEPFINRSEFAEWIEQNEDAKELNAELLKALDSPILPEKKKTKKNKTEKIDETGEKHSYGVLRRKKRFFDFYEALNGRDTIFNNKESGDKIKGLRDGNRELMIKVLHQNPNLRSILEKYLDNEEEYNNSPIKRWYDDNYQKRDKYLRLLSTCQNRAVTLPLRLKIRDIYHSKKLSNDEKETATEQLFVDTYFQLRESRFLGISKTADALEKIINSPSKEGLDLPGKYGKQFRVPHDVTGHIKPIIRETFIREVCFIEKREEPEGGWKDYDVRSVSIKKPVAIMMDIRKSQNENFMSEAESYIESRRIPDPKPGEEHKDYDANYAEYVNNYIDGCMATLDKDGPKNNKKLTESRENKFKMQLILNDFIKQGILGKQHSRILNKNEMEQNKNDFPFIYAVQQLKIVLARTKTQNPVKVELETFIDQLRNRLNKKPLTNKRIINYCKKLSDTINYDCSRAREMRRKIDSEGSLLLSCLSIFPFYGQSNLADALKKFNTEVMTPLINSLEKKEQEKKMLENKSKKIVNATSQINQSDSDENDNDDNDDYSQKESKRSPSPRNHYY